MAPLVRAFVSGFSLASKRTVYRMDDVLARNSKTDTSALDRFFNSMADYRVISVISRDAVNDWIWATAC